MAHFAQIIDNRVASVIVVNNEMLMDEDGVENESLGSQFCTDTFGGHWVQTSYNSNFRGKYAGVGDIYNAELDIFEEIKKDEADTL